MGSTNHFFLALNSSSPRAWIEATIPRGSACLAPEPWDFLIKYRVLGTSMTALGFMHGHAY